MFVIAFLASQILTLILGLISLGTAILVLKLTVAFLKGGEPVKVTAERFKTDGIPFTEVAIPRELRGVEQYILQKLKVDGDDYESLMGRFLHSINVHDGSRQLPDYFYNGVVKKMMWEYNKKFGNLNVKLGATGLLKPELVTDPIADNERDAFRRFCLDHTL